MANRIYKFSSSFDANGYVIRIGSIDYYYTLFNSDFNNYCEHCSVLTSLRVIEMRLFPNWIEEYAETGEIKTCKRILDESCCYLCYDLYIFLESLFFSKMRDLIA